MAVIPTQVGNITKLYAIFPAAGDWSRRKDLSPAGERLFSRPPMNKSVMNGIGINFVDLCIKKKKTYITTLR